MGPWNLDEYAQSLYGPRNLYTARGISIGPWNITETYVSSIKSNDEVFISQRLLKSTYFQYYSYDLKRFNDEGIARLL